MTTALVSTASVHETAAACDYLGDREDVDSVVGVAVAPPDDPAGKRDAGEALNVLRVRLPGPEVATETREGDVLAGTLAAAADRDPDELVVADSFEDLGRLLVEADRPVVVVPTDEF